MVVETKDMTGEELLLISAGGGESVEAAVEQELDRRALLGSRRERKWYRPDKRALAVVGGPLLRVV